MGTTWIIPSINSFKKWLKIKWNVFTTNTVDLKHFWKVHHEHMIKNKFVLFNLGCWIVSEKVEECVCCPSQQT